MPKPDILPTPGPRPWTKRRFPAVVLRGSAALVVAIASIVLAVLGVARAWAIPAGGDEGAMAAATWGRWIAGTTVGTTTLGFAVSLATWFWEAWTAWAEDRDHQNVPQELIGCLRVGHEVLQLAAPPNANIRLTLHRRDKAKRQVAQLVDYVGATGGSGRGRTFSDRSGVVGKAITSAAPAVMHRPEGASLEAYLDELCRVWGMPREEAQSLTGHNQMSFMAAPISENGVVIGVLFVDCDQPSFFDETMQGRVLCISRGVVRFRRGE